MNENKDTSNGNVGRKRTAEVYDRLYADRFYAEEERMVAKEEQVSESDAAVKIFLLQFYKAPPHCSLRSPTAPVHSGYERLHILPPKRLHILSPKRLHILSPKII